MKNETVISEDLNNYEKCIIWIKKHKKEILIAGGGVVVGGCVVWLTKEIKVKDLKSIISMQNDIIADNEYVIERLKELCAQKELARVELASDALRHGSSKGAQEMVALREAIKVA